MKHRLTLIAVSLVSAIALLLSFAAPAIASVQGSGEESDIEITFEARESEQSAGCFFDVLRVTPSVSNTADAFTLRATVPVTLCEGIEASAVIYEMPGNGVQWPQTLRERSRIIVKKAGVYTFTFTKTCMPAQFDVINGRTPVTINSPLDHGPLLFPFNTDTALQYWGKDCPPPTTTTSTVPETTTSTVPETTTTVTAPTTTTVTPSTTTSTLPPELAPPLILERYNCAEVGLTNITPDQPEYSLDLDSDADGVACEATQVTKLAFTGPVENVLWIALGGVALLVAGLALSIPFGRKPGDDDGVRISDYEDPTYGVPEGYEDEA